MHRLFSFHLDWATCSRFLFPGWFSAAYTRSPSSVSDNGDWSRISWHRCPSCDVISIGAEGKTSAHYYTGNRQQESSPGPRTATICSRARQPARTLLAHLELLMDPQGELTPSCRPQVFFLSTSCRMCRSRVRSATRRFNRAFSSRNCLSWRSSLTPRLPYFFFQM